MASCLQSFMPNSCLPQHADLANSRTLHVSDSGTAHLPVGVNHYIYDQFTTNLPRMNRREFLKTNTLAVGGISTVSARIMAAGKTDFDFIVLGVGSMGSSTCYHLASRGYKVLGLEQFGLVHENGSHGGQSRLIRKAYFEHPDYIPLLERAYSNWTDIEKRSGRRIYHETGIFYAAPKGHNLLTTVRKSAAAYNLQLENLDLKTTGERYPQFTLSENFDSLIEPVAGFVVPSEAISAYTVEARKFKADIRTGVKVQRWEKIGSGVKVYTDKGAFTCRKLIITAGAWADRFIPGIKDKLKVTRQVLAWVKPAKTEAFSLGRFPCWIMADEGMPSTFYGFPMLPEDLFGKPHGLKLAYHVAGVPSDPDHVNRVVTSADLEAIEQFLRRRIPGGFTSVVDTKTCLYSYSPDENFIVDNLPGFEDSVCIAWGFSGHGFKFASVIGEILADLALDGKTKLPIGFLNARRFG